MWVKFDKLQQEERTSARTGRDYTAHVLYGTKIGGDWGEDQPYERILFDTHTCTVTTRDNKTYQDASIVNFIVNNVEPGDVIELKMKRSTTIPKLFDIDEIRFVNKPFPDATQGVPTKSIGDATPGEGNPTPPWITPAA